MSTPPQAAWMTVGEMSRRVGVSTDRLRAWERRYGLLRPRRSEGNYRLYSAVDEARVRLMQRHLAAGVPAAQAAELTIAARFSVRPGGDTTVAGDEASATREEIRQALERFDETSAQRALERLFAAFTPLTVLRDVVIPYMHDVGERWAANHITVAQEHFATVFFHARLLALARGWDRGLGPRALLACPAGEQHVLALIAFGVALHSMGWRVTYLGPDTPLPMVAEVATAVEPQLVALSSAMQGRFEDVGALRSLASSWTLALAGPGVDEHLAREAGAHHLVGDPITVAGTLGADQVPVAS
jgi:DNA-binding transcriptional MerR regulator